jgi:hypothetical protein
MDPDAMHKGNNYFQKYELECQRLQGQGMEVRTAVSNDRIAAGGWVGSGREV